MPTQLDTPRGVSGTIDRNTNTLLTPMPATGAITSSSLTPSQNFSLTPPKPATEAAGFLGYMGATATQLAQEKAQADASKNDLFTSMFKSDTEGGLTDQLYRDSVDPAKAELNDINNKILAEQVSTRHQIEALQKNPQGLFGGALQDRIDEIQTKSLSKQADLAVIQLSKQGRYDSAVEIADRAVNAILEKQRLRNEALKFNYQENKELFNKDEQRAFEVSQKERDRQLENEEFRLRAQFEQKIKQSDPLYQASLAKARADAVAAQNDLAGGVLTDAQVKAIDTSPQGKKVTTLGDLKQKLSNYQTLIDTYGTASFGKQKAELESAYNELKIAYKTAADLGAIQAPDIPVIEGALKNATFANPLTQGFAKLTGGGVGSIKAGLSQAMQTLDNSAATNITQLYARNPTYRNSEYVASLVDPLSVSVADVQQFDTARPGQILKLPDNTYVQKQKDGTFKQL